MTASKALTALIALCVIMLAPPASAQGGLSVDPQASFAWSESTGWINFAPGQGAAVTLSDNIMSGFAWSESAGWINLGDGEPDAGDQYSNASAADFGVNHDDDGGLSGYAWSESLGWINFDTSGDGGSQVAVGTDGQMTGYAWSESAGWISFDSGYGVRFIGETSEGEPVDGEAGNEDGEAGTEEGEAEPVDGEAGNEEGEAEPVDGEAGNEDGEAESMDGEASVDGEASFDGEGDSILDAAAEEALMDFQVLDVDRDGRISPQEALNGGVLADFFDLLDSNGDGLLTTAELQDAAGEDSPVHSADQDADGALKINELLRVIQFYNARGYGCAPLPGDTEDGYRAGAGQTDCRRHASDYAPENGVIELGEMLRLIQLYNLVEFESCGRLSEDGFCFEDE